MSLCALITLVLHFNFFLRLRVGFPHLSVFGVALLVPPQITTGLWILELLFLIGVLFSASSAPFFHVLHILWAVGWFLLDQNIWCPQLAHFAVISWSCITQDKSPLQIFTFFLYFYGGIQKLNHCFLFKGKGISDFSKCFLRHLRIDITKLPSQLLQLLALLSAAIEILTGLGFLFSPTVPYAVFLGICTHIVILLCVGPWGSNSCHGIWAWNVMCLVMLPFIFTSPSHPYADLLGHFNLSSLLSLVLWGVLPVVNMTIGWWSDEISFKLHSMNFGFCAMKIHPPEDIEDTSKYYQLVSRKVPRAGGLPFVDEYGVVEVDHIARQYSHSTSTSPHAALLWAQYLAEEWNEQILFTFYYSPSRWDGTRARDDYIFSPQGKKLARFLNDD
eukprot:TRINITY_DN10201_c0_g1_i1.p1 TRINITY_DN10201_c0_g1~~TRINITY_DN10201_c0_g1_i1.p1  ORF type:complete len:435 (-),score=97.81 TRINITY_DN10201_c0_g1_i1:1192-2355(-)